MGEPLKNFFGKNLLGHEIYGPLEYKILFEKFVKPSPTLDPSTKEMCNHYVVCSSLTLLHRLQHISSARFRLSNVIVFCTHLLGPSPHDHDWRRLACLSLLESKTTVASLRLLQSGITGFSIAMHDSNKSTSASKVITTLKNFRFTKLGSVSASTSTSFKGKSKAQRLLGVLQKHCLLESYYNVQIIKMCESQHQPILFSLQPTLHPLSKPGRSHRCIPKDAIRGAYPLNLGDAPASLRIRHTVQHQFGEGAQLNFVGALTIHFDELLTLDVGELRRSNSPQACEHACERLRQVEIIRGCNVFQTDYVPDGCMCLEHVHRLHGTAETHLFVLCPFVLRQTNVVYKQPWWVRMHLPCHTLNPRRRRGKEKIQKPAGLKTKRVRMLLCLPAMRYRVDPHWTFARTIEASLDEFCLLQVLDLLLGRLSAWGFPRTLIS